MRQGTPPDPRRTAHAGFSGAHRVNAWWLLAVTLLSIAPLAVAGAHAETGFDTVRFIHYLDEDAALGEVRNGNLDMYYWGISPNRLADAASRDGLRIYESTGSTYSIMANPAQTETFNPFSLRDVRFALNYLVDRDLIVNELLHGYGVPLTSAYGPYDPEYTSIIDQLESYNFRYDPALAREMISSAMAGAGASLDTDGVWTMDGQPVAITFFVRSDDPFRKSIGEVVSAELRDAGFVVNQVAGDLNKALVSVYGSDPADLQWHLYTEGWGRSDFVRYDSVELAEKYAPWYGLMPGANNPSFWNYQHPRLDNLTQAVYSGDFGSAEERTAMVREAVAAGIDDGVRVFLVGSVDQYVTNEGVNGVINAFGAGVPSRFTTINAHSDRDTLNIGVKHIYQGSWNPVAGLLDWYSNTIWYAVHDPFVFRHPYSGAAMPVRSEWQMDTAGPGGSLEVPSEAILWDVDTRSWTPVGEGASATSVVTFHYSFGNWHHGIPAGMDDMLYAVYFLTEWGTDGGAGDLTVDPQYTPRTAQQLDTIKGIRVIDQDTMEVYVDYWHFDGGEIAHWASIEMPMPWEIYHAMEGAVLDGQTQFSRPAATSKNTGWLSVLIPDDAAIIREHLAGFLEGGEAPAALSGTTEADHLQRYESAIAWIDTYGHAVISNGPYVMQGYAPELRIITIREFVDDAYPFEADRWSEFETVRTPKITKIEAPRLVASGTTLEISVETSDASDIRYFMADAGGNILESGQMRVADGNTTLLMVDTAGLPGWTTISFKVFALSEEVLRPDSHSAHFIVYP